MVMSLLYRFNVIVKCVCYMSLGFSGCFVTVATITGGHYKTYIISGVGHLRSDLVVPLLLWAIAYNIRGTSVVLQVPRDNVKLVEREYYLR